MLTVKDVISFLEVLPPDMEVPAILAKMGGADYLNLAFERRAVEGQQRQVQQEADKAYESYVTYKNAHQNIPVDSVLFMETELLQNDLLNAFAEAEERTFAIRTVLETCIEAFVEANMTLLEKVETEMAGLPQYGGRRKH
jgi:hypothetical protein